MLLKQLNLQMEKGDGNPSNKCKKIQLLCTNIRGFAYTGLWMARNNITNLDICCNYVSMTYWVYA